MGMTARIASKTTQAATPIWSASSMSALHATALGSSRRTRGLPEAEVHANGNQEGPHSSHDGTPPVPDNASVNGVQSRRQATANGRQHSQPNGLSASARGF